VDWAELVEEGFAAGVFGWVVLVASIMIVCGVEL